MLDWPDVSFMWPQLLWLLALVPVSVLVYLWARRHSPSSVASVCLGLAVSAGLVALLAATARPQVQISLPTRVDKLMVVLDISGSMRADDVKPTRFDAARQTVLALIEQQPAALRVGLVTAAATATMVQAPTTDRDALKDTLNGVSLQTGSALGSGLLIALTELIPGAGIDAQAIINASLSGQVRPSGPIFKPAPAFRQAPGSNKTMAILLLSDGESNMGPDLRQMAELAAEFGVRVYTIGIGTRQGAVVKAEGISQRVRMDPTMLADVAQTTLGTFYEGASRDELKSIYGAIQASVQFERKQTLEVTALLTAAGLLLVLLGMGVTLAWRGRVI